MKLLLDTCTFLWIAGGGRALPPAVAAAYQSPDNEVFLSAASVWELGLKIARGKLKLPEDYAPRLLAHGFEELPVSITHAARATTLPPLHGDPFDRLLIAQALAEGLMLVTSDRAIMRYDVPTMEA